MLPVASIRKDRYSTSTKRYIPLSASNDALLTIAFNRVDRSLNVPIAELCESLDQRMSAVTVVRRRIQKQLVHMMVNHRVSSSWDTFGITAAVSDHNFTQITAVAAMEPVAHAL